VSGRLGPTFLALDIVDCRLAARDVSVGGGEIRSSRAAATKPRPVELSLSGPLRLLRASAAIAFRGGASNGAHTRSKSANTAAVMVTRTTSCMARRFALDIALASGAKIGQSDQVVRQPGDAARFGDRWRNAAMYSALIAVIVVGGWWWGGRARDDSLRNCDRRQELCVDSGWTGIVTFAISLVLLVAVVASRPIRPAHRGAMAAVAALGSIGLSRSLSHGASIAIAIAVAALTMIPRRRLDFGE
jgi:hypothetical protein